MTEPLVVVGAGGFGREVLDLVRAVNAASDAPLWDVVGVVDDSPSPDNVGRLGNQGVVALGDVATYVRDNPPTAYVIGIGAPPVRRFIAQQFDQAGWPAAVLVHPMASIGTGVTLGHGTIICAGARVSTNVSVGRHSHMDVNATIGHDTRLGDYVRLNPGSSVSGDCVIEDGVLIGVAGVVLNGLTVGTDATVGGSACVVGDVVPGAVVKGVPAK